MEMIRGGVFGKEENGGDQSSNPTPQENGENLGSVELGGEITIIEEMDGLVGGRTYGI